MKIDTFYDKLQPNQIYEFGQIVQDYPDFINYVVSALEKSIDSKAFSNNFTVKVTEDLKNNKIIVHSFMTDLLFADQYVDTIPENGLNYVTTLQKEDESVINKICEVSIPTYEYKIKINFELRKVVFQIKNKKEIKFPEDYFLKGYGILGEKASTLILNTVAQNTAFISKKNQYSEVKNLCLFRLKEKMNKKVA